MALFPASPGDLPHYGYQPERQTNLNKLDARWERIANQNWLRSFEVKIPAPAKAPCCFDESGTARFHEVTRAAFQYIAKRHQISPIKMWRKVEAGLLVCDMHHDDLAFVEEFIFSFEDFSVETMERFRWRYPKRCPLLDVLCSLDDTYQPLNDLQDWLLEMKGSTGRRRNDVLPPLPDPNGVRPVGVPA